MEFLEFGIREEIRGFDGAEPEVVARFLLEGDRDDFLESLKSHCGSSYRYVPIRFVRKEKPLKRKGSR